MLFLTSSSSKVVKLKLKEYFTHMNIDSKQTFCHLTAEVGDLQTTMISEVIYRAMYLPYQYDALIVHKPLTF